MKIGLNEVGIILYIIAVILYIIMRRKND